MLSTDSHILKLGTTLSKSERINDEVANRIAKASAVFVNISKKIWKRKVKGLNLKPRLKVYIGCCPGLTDIFL